MAHARVVFLRVPLRCRRGELIPAGGRVMPVRRPCRRHEKPGQAGLNPPALGVGGPSVIPEMGDG